MPLIHIGLIRVPKLYVLPSLSYCTWSTRQERGGRKYCISYILWSVSRNRQHSPRTLDTTIVSWTPERIAPRCFFMVTPSIEVLTQRPIRAARHSPSSAKASCFNTDARIHMHQGGLW